MHDNSEWTDREFQSDDDGYLPEEEWDDEPPARLTDFDACLRVADPCAADADDAEEFLFGLILAKKR